MFAKIYRPAKSAMQSGLANTKEWVLEFDAEAAKSIDPLMGWTSSGDMNQQVRLTFHSMDEAVEYAQRHAIPHQVIQAKPRRRVIKSYADNFSFDRKQPWSH